MGLGPPVCTLCKLIMAYHEETPYWWCAQCESGEIDTCLWELSSDDQRVYNRRTREFNTVLEIRERRERATKAIRELECLSKRF